MSIQPLILKNGVISFPRSAADMEELKASLSISTSNFVDVSSNQTIGGIKTFSNTIILPSTSGTSVGSVWRNVDNLEYKDGSNVTKVILNSAGNLSNLANKQTSLNNLVGTQVTNRVLRSDGTNVTLSQVALDTDVINVLSLSNGGTGSNSQNFIDLTNNQGNIGGIKTFTSPIYSKQLLTGYSSNTVNTAVTDTDAISSIFGKTFHWVGADWTPTTNPGVSVSCLGMEFNTLGTVDISTGGAYAGFFRYRHQGTSTVTTAQGVRLLGLNVSTGTVTNLTGAFFTARNDSTGTVTNLTGGEFVATSGSAGTITTIIGGKFTASITNVNATTTTLIGSQIIVGSTNTIPATNAIGLDIANITGTASNKIPLRVGTGGSSYFNDTTASTSTTTGAVVVLGGFAADHIKTKNAWLLEPRTSNVAQDLNAQVYGQFAAARWLDGSVTNTNGPVNAGMLLQLDSLFGTGATESKYRVQEFLSVGSGVNARFWKRTENNGTWGTWLEIGFLEKANSWTGVQSITNSTASTSTTTGAFKISGGGSVVGNWYVGGSLVCTSAIVNFSALPTSSTGLSAGQLWRNGNVINIV